MSVPMRRTRAEWAAWVAEVAAGGSATEISRREGLRRQTLLWWKWRLGHEQRVATKKGTKKSAAKQALTAFLPVESQALQITAASHDPHRGRAEHEQDQHDVIVELSHLAVRVAVGTDPGYVAALVHALRAPC